MKLVAVSTFLHGRMRFEKGTAYEIPDLFAGFFLGNGWMMPYGGDDVKAIDLALLNPNAPLPERKGDTLEIQDTSISTSANVGG